MIRNLVWQFVYSLRNILFHREGRGTISEGLQSRRKALKVAIRGMDPRKGLELILTHIVADSLGLAVLDDKDMAVDCYMTAAQKSAINTAAEHDFRIGIRCPDPLLPAIFLRLVATLRMRSNSTIAS